MENSGRLILTIIHHRSVQVRQDALNDFKVYIQELSKQQCGLGTVGPGLKMDRPTVL